MRRAPLPRKRTKARRKPSVRCRFQRCTKPPRAEGLCRTHLTREADRLFSLYVRARDGACRACGTTEGLQAAHLVSRRYRALRWHPEGAVALCAADHKRYTEHPLEWEAWVNAQDGLWSWSRLRRHALENEPQDPADALAWLHGEVAA